MISSRQYTALWVIFVGLGMSCVLGYSGGAGTPVNPYQIASVADFMQLSNAPADWNKSFIMTADIDLAGIVFTQSPIAPWSSQEFSGQFNGNSYRVLNLTIVAPAHTGVGLFGFIGSRGMVTDLGVENVRIQGNTSVGGLAGYNGGGISYCYATGLVKGISFTGGVVGSNTSMILFCYSTCLVDGEANVGGLAGDSTGTITYSYAAGTISGNQNVGGLIGVITRGTVECSYSTSSVFGTGSAVGGLVGGNTSGTVQNCFASGTVIAKGGSQIGGLIGNNNGPIFNCYSTCAISAMGPEVGGLLGRNTAVVKYCYAAGIVQVRENLPYIGGMIGANMPPASVESCFWDIDVSRQSASAGGEGKTTTQMKVRSTFSDAGWDFALKWGDGDKADWWIKTNCYPMLFPDYSGGDGSLKNPFQIATVEDFKALSNTPAHWNSCFIMTSDIDLAQVSFTEAPIAPGGVIKSQYPPLRPWITVEIWFTGVFDGSRHIISNLSISTPDLPPFPPLSLIKRNTGLFGRIGSRGKIQKLGLKDVAIQGNSGVGGIAGENAGVITNCYVTGSVKGDNAVGGFVGRNAGKIAFCYAANTISSRGGLGGLIGDSIPNRGEVFASFWDIEVSGHPESDGGIGKTTAEMMTRSTFTASGWDFVSETANGTEDIWTIREGKTYPLFVWQNTPPAADAGPDQTVYAWIDGSASATLDGSASYDEDGDELDYAWMLNGQVVAAESDPTISLPVGVHTLSLVVSDGLAESEPEEVIITVVAAQTGYLKMLPSVINRKSNMPYVMALFQLPKGIHSLEGKALLYPDGIECRLQRLFRIGQFTTVFAWFSKEELMRAVTDTGNVELTLVGKQPDGSYLYGKDCVKIIH